MSKAVSPMRVLVVDDDREICDYMETFLSKDGLEVKTLSDPEKVADEVKNGGYHMVVLDLMMPKVDGVEVLQRIRKVDSDVAVVIFTGYPVARERRAVDEARRRRLPEEAVRPGRVPRGRRPRDAQEGLAALARGEPAPRDRRDRAQPAQGSATSRSSRWRAAPACRSRCCRRSSAPNRARRSARCTRSPSRSTCASRTCSATTERSCRDRRLARDARRAQRQRGLQLASRVRAPS